MTGLIEVNVTLAFVPTKLVLRTEQGAWNTCQVQGGVSWAACAGFAIWGSMGDRHNATATIWFEI